MVLESGTRNRLRNHVGNYLGPAICGRTLSKVGEMHTGIQGSSGTIAETKQRHPTRVSTITFTLWTTVSDFFNEGTIIGAHPIYHISVLKQRSPKLNMQIFAYNTSLKGAHHDYLITYSHHFPTFRTAAGPKLKMPINSSYL